MQLSLLIPARHYPENGGKKRAKLVTQRVKQQEREPARISAGQWLILGC